MKNSYNSRIIAIIGSWGTGKSTVREILREIILNPKSTLDKIEKNKFDDDKKISANNTKSIYEQFIPEDAPNNSIVVTYEAMQFEEPSQVTSELYNTIANTIFKQNTSQFKLYNPDSAYRKFRSIAYLKKESFGSNISTTHIILLFKFIIFSVLGKLVIDAIVAELETYDPLFFIIDFINHIWNLSNHIFYSLLLYISLAVFALTKADAILRIITGFLARTSHIDILKSISLDQPLFLLIDEIDRLNPEAVKLLFDEVLILKETWKNKKQNITIFMFYDENVVLHQHKQLNTYEPHIFLQKFYDDVYRLPKVHFDESLSIAIMMMLLPKEISHISHISHPSHPNFTRSSSKWHYPNYKIIEQVSHNIHSFRQFEKFINYLYDTMFEYCYEEWPNNIIINDIFLIALSLKHIFGINQLDDNINLIKNNVYGNYLIKIIENLQSLYKFNSLSQCQDYILRLINNILQIVTTDQTVQLKKYIKTESILSYCQPIWLKYYRGGTDIVEKQVSILLDNGILDDILSFSSEWLFRLDGINIINWAHLNSFFSIDKIKFEEFKQKIITMFHDDYNQSFNYQTFKNVVRTSISTYLFKLSDDKQFCLSLDNIKTIHKNHIHFLQLILEILIEPNNINIINTILFDADPTNYKNTTVNGQKCKKKELKKITNDHYKINSNFLCVLFSKSLNYNISNYKDNIKRFYSHILPYLQKYASTIFNHNPSIFSYQAFKIIYYDILDHKLSHKIRHYRLRKNNKEKMEIALCAAILKGKFIWLYGAMIYDDLNIIMDILNKFDQSNIAKLANKLENKNINDIVERLEKVKKLIIDYNKNNNLLFFVNQCNTLMSDFSETTA